MTTWNGIDRIAADDPVYCGRPNTWGQRSANLLLAQADVIVALGTRLGLQQTGFNWQEFAPVRQVVQVDIDPAELAKGHPRVDLPINADADDLLAGSCSTAPRPLPSGSRSAARSAICCRSARPANEHAAGLPGPLSLPLDLSARRGDEDVVIPCSSGGANFVFDADLPAALGPADRLRQGLRRRWAMGSRAGSAPRSPSRTAARS